MTVYAEQSLNGSWELRDAFLTCTQDQLESSWSRLGGWIPTPVPGDIHQGLMDAGVIPDPLVGRNSFECAWTEERSWWFRRAFQLPAAWLEAEVIELSLEGLDANAEVYVNGRHAASHINSFRPCVIDIKPYAVEGDNEMLVRLSVGTEHITDADVNAPEGWVAGEPAAGRPERGDRRRVMVRKPQYSWGWDWGPRLATTAIGGDVTLRAISGAVIRDVHLAPIRPAGPLPDAVADEVIVRAAVTVEKLHFFRTENARVRVKMTDQGGRTFSAEKAVLLRSGTNFVDMNIRVDSPRLWWSASLGEQHLYRVEAELELDAGMMKPAPIEWGLRFVELDTDGVFALVVNGCRVFCKGANWIPADAMYARTSDERYETLLREAEAAHFNMLRIWGGGWYERDTFYRLCDRLGLLIWHDFMFACSPYPDHLEWFRDEVRAEAEHQTRRLRNHACMALWCGNNECSWGFDEWWGGGTRGGATLYNHILPRAVRENCPEIPYWNGSPFGGEHPNGSDAGDRHHWFDCMMNPEMSKRITPEEYDKCTSLFVSEYGYVGACRKQTVIDYLDGAPMDPAGDVWQHHNNTFELQTVPAGIAKHYADPESLTIDEYLHYSGLAQALMYGYSLESFRYRPKCHGGLFWMYNDCWGEVGWTIIDYYLRRKPSWYAVRRALAPLRLIARAEGDGIRVVVANDTRADEAFTLEFGYVSLDGTVSDLQRTNVHAPGLHRTDACRFPRGSHDDRHGLWIARALDRDDLEPALFRARDYRELAVVDPGLSATVERADGDTCVVRVSAQRYAHAVWFDLPDGAKPTDAAFDVLPGQAKSVSIRGLDRLTHSDIAVTCANMAGSVTPR